MVDFKSEQILALAPDPGSAKAGKELASSRKWIFLGYNHLAAWGKCQGSAKEPYQTQIDLREPAFKCSCPSRKFPCKHALGLFLLLATQPGSFAQGEPPAWVTEWLTKRTQAAQKPAKTRDSEKKPDPASQERRAAKREDRIRQGLADLDLWLNDLMRQGLSASQAQPTTFWETPAARLVDAQAPGLARKVREMAGTPGSGEGWQERLLAQAGELHLLVKGYQRLDQLPPQTQADIRSLIGWSQDQEELLQREGVVDCWTVLSKRVKEEPLGALGRSSALKVQRTWLRGKGTRHAALVLSFAAPGQILDTTLIPGTSMEAELVFFPGAFPLRALVKNHITPAVVDPVFQGFPTLLEAHHAYAAALTANPWLDLFPVPLNDVTPFQTGEGWGVRDLAGAFLPVAPGYPQIWNLLALSGGHPLDLFAEWNGETLWPLSVSSHGRFIPLQPVKAEEQRWA
jgi:hypothetical protein